jgi:hypothetical protein
MSQKKQYNVNVTYGPSWKNARELIKEVDIPSWSFLCQTTNGEQPIYNYVDSVKEYIKQSKELHDKIKNEALRHI